MVKIFKRKKEAPEDAPTKLNYVSLTIGEAEYRTLSTKKYENRAKWSPHNVKEIKSHIPGTLVKLNVKEGAAVKTGDLLLVYEAMKMQNRVLAPFSGTIKTIYVNEGDRLPKGTLIMMYE